MSPIKVHKCEDLELYVKSPQVCHNSKGEHLREKKIFVSGLILMCHPLMGWPLEELLSIYTNTSEFKPVLRYVFCAPQCCVRKDGDVRLFIWGC